METISENNKSKPEGVAIPPAAPPPVEAGTQEPPVDKQPVQETPVAEAPTAPPPESVPTGEIETVAQTTKKTAPAKKKSAAKKAATKSATKKSATKKSTTKTNKGGKAPAKKSTAKKSTAKPPEKKKPVVKKKPAPPPKAAADWYLNLSQIVLPDNWNREEIGDISGMVSSMSELGQLQPVAVRPTSDPRKFELRVGRRRFAAAQEMGKTRIKCCLDVDSRKVSDRAKALAENLVRQGNTPYEIAHECEAMAQEGMTNENIAKACGVSPGFVSQHRAVMRAPAKLQNGLRTGKVKISVFRAFSKLDPETDKKFYVAAMEKALKGTDASKISAQIETYLQKKEEKAATTAGGKKPPKTRKGGAAHQRKGPKYEVRDYTSEDTYKNVTMVKKSDAVALMQEQAEKLKDAATKDRRTYYQGALDGMELLSGLTR